MRTVVLPNGREVRLSSYVAAWKLLRAMDPSDLVDGFDAFGPVEAGTILRAIRQGAADRINKHSPAHSKGYLWHQDHQSWLQRDARLLNSRAVVRWTELHPWTRARVNPARLHSD